MFHLIHTVVDCCLTVDSSICFLPPKGQRCQEKKNPEVLVPVPFLCCALMNVQPEDFVLHSFWAWFKLADASLCFIG